MYLVVYQRLLVPNRMFYPIIIFIPIIHYRNSCRIISQPNTFFFININNINIVSVHCIIAFIISSNIRMCNTCIHIHFMYSHPFRSNQQFFLIQRTDSGNIYINALFFNSVKRIPLSVAMKKWLLSTCSTICTFPCITLATLRIPVSFIL